MPVNHASLTITSSYQQALEAVTARSEATAKAAWQKVDFKNLDRSFVPVGAQVSLAIKNGQREATRMAAGYATAFLSSELGTRTATLPVETAAYVGKSFNGKPVNDAVHGPIITVKKAVQDQKSDPMGLGLRALLSMVDLTVKDAGRTALQDIYQRDDRITGWRRATSGTCPACLALASSYDLPPGTPLRIHPYCKCVAEPVVGGLAEKAIRPSGEQQFEAMSREQQDVTFGAMIAEALRQGILTLLDLVAEVGGFIKPKPAQDIPITPLVAASATGGTKDFDPNQPRDPHTGEWVHLGGKLPKLDSDSLIKALEGQGVPLTEEKVRASSLKKAKKAGKGEPVMVTSDNYVVHGHDLVKAAGDSELTVIRVGASLSKVLDIAHAEHHYQHQQRAAHRRFVQGPEHDLFELLASGAFKAYGNGYFANVSPPHQPLTAEQLVRLTLGTKDYNPDQLRGPDGRWISAGGDLAAFNAGSSFDIKAYLDGPGYTGPLPPGISRDDVQGSKAYRSEVKDHGKAFKVKSAADDPKTEGLMGEPHGCFNNAIMATAMDPSFHYVEGFVWAKGDPAPVPHAWVVNDKGEALDVTLPPDQVGVSYFGVPLDTAKVKQGVVERGVGGPALDWPEIQKELKGGKQPDLAAFAVPGDPTPRNLQGEELHAPADAARAALPDVERYEKLKARMDDLNRQADDRFRRYMAGEFHSPATIRRYENQANQVSADVASAESPLYNFADKHYGSFVTDLEQIIAAIRADAQRGRKDFNPDEPRDPLGQWVHVPEAGDGTFFGGGFSPFDERGKIGMRQALKARGHSPQAIAHAEQIMDRWTHDDKSVEFDIVRHLNQDTPTGQALRDRIKFETSAAEKVAQETPNTRLYREGSMDLPMLHTTQNPRGAQSLQITGETPHFAPDHSAKLSTLLSRYAVLGGYHEAPGYAGEEEVALIDRRILDGRAQVQTRSEQHFGSLGGLGVGSGALEGRKVLNAGTLSPISLDEKPPKSDADRLRSMFSLMRKLTYQQPGDNAPAVSPGMSYYALRRRRDGTSYTEEHSVDEVLAQMEHFKPDLDREAAKTEIAGAAHALNRDRPDAPDMATVLMKLMGFDAVTYTDQHGEPQREIYGVPYDPMSGEREIVFTGGKAFNPDQPRGPHTGQWIHVGGDAPKITVGPGTLSREQRYAAQDSDGNEIGHMDVASHDSLTGNGIVNYIEVSPKARHQNVATALVNRWRSDHPDQHLAANLMSPQGGALWHHLGAEFPSAPLPTWNDAGALPHTADPTIEPKVTPELGQGPPAQGNEVLDGGEKYVGGFCTDLAVAFQRRDPSLKIRAVYDGDPNQGATLEHAVAYNPKTGEAYDARGVHASVDEALSGWTGSREVRRDEKASDILMTPGDDKRLAEADKFINRYWGPPPHAADPVIEPKVTADTPGPLDWQVPPDEIGSDGYLHLYHGTTTENVDQITGSGTFRQTPNTIYPAQWPVFTTSREQAARYAPSRPDATVVELRIKPEDAPRFFYPPIKDATYGFPSTNYALRGDMALGKAYNPDEARGPDGRWISSGVHVSEAAGGEPLGGHIHVEEFHASLDGKPPGAHGDWVHVGDQQTAESRVDQVRQSLGEGGEVADVTRAVVLHGEKFDPKTYRVTVDGPALNTMSDGRLPKGHETGTVSDQFANFVTAGTKWVKAEDAAKQGFHNLPQTFDGQVQIPMTEAERLVAAQQMNDNMAQSAIDRDWVVPQQSVLDQLKRGLTGAIYYDNTGEQSFFPSIVVPKRYLTVHEGKAFNPDEPRGPDGRWIATGHPSSFLAPYRGPIEDIPYPGTFDVPPSDLAAFEAQDSPAQAEGRLRALLPKGAKIERRDIGTEDAVTPSGRNLGPSLDPLHRIVVTDPQGSSSSYPGIDDNSIAHLSWHRDTGEISSIEVAGEHQRKGIAAAMLNLARAQAKTEGTARPEHSANLTPAGAQFAQGTGETHLFATPARSERQDAASYYSTPRWEQFETDVKRQADDLGVTINDRHLTQGIWSDTPEPSAAFYLHGEHTNELAARVGRYWNQDAVLNFTPGQQRTRGGFVDAPDAEWHFFDAGRDHSAAEILAAAKKHGLYGATRDGNDIVVVAGPGVGAPEDQAALTAFGEELGATRAKRFAGTATMIWNPELPIGERPEGAPTYDTYDPQGDRRKAGGVSGRSRYNGDAPDPERAEAQAEAFAAKAADLLLERLGLKGYDPHEPRDPATGQWIKGAGAEIAAEDVAAGDRITSGSGATGTITSREPHKVPGTADRLHIQLDGDPPSYTSPLVTELRKFTRQRKDPWKVHRPQTGGEHTFPHEEAFTGKPTDVGGDVAKAAQLLSEGKPVKLQHKREVTALLDKISEIVKDAQAKGEKAPTYDLCKVVVPGTNLFCSKTKGIPRIDMPQLTGIPQPGSPASLLPKDDRGNVDLTPSFIAHLKASGFKVTPETERADHLRPTQMQLNGAKVAGIVGFLNSGGTIEGGPLVVSKDNYIVDGHHRWASEVAQSLASGHEQKQKVLRVDIGIIDLLREALKFSEANGINPQSVSDTSGKAWEALLKVFNPDQARDPHTGQWIRSLSSYSPDPDAPKAGEFVMEPDPTGTYSGGVAASWRQNHEALVRDALRSWIGDPVTMSSRMADERAGLPQPDSGGGKQMRAQAAALLWELEHKAKPNTVPLYRGDSPVLDFPVNIGGYQSWSESSETANLFSHPRTNPGARVVRLLPGQALGIRLADYGEGSLSEQEWIARPVGVSGKTFDPAQPRDDHGRWVHIPGTGTPSLDLDQAIDHYAEGWSSPINDRLRGLPTAGKYGLSKKQIDDEIAAMDVALRERAIPIPERPMSRVVTGFGHHYRGLNLAKVTPQVRDAIDHGGSFTDAGFISTTDRTDIADGFAEQPVTSSLEGLPGQATEIQAVEGAPNEPVILDVRVPPGTKALFIDHAAGQVPEGEMVLPRGGSFKVVTTTMSTLYPGGDPQRIVTVDWTPPPHAA